MYHMLALSRAYCCCCYFKARGSFIRRRRGQLQPRIKPTLRTSRQKCANVQNTAPVFFFLFFFSTHSASSRTWKYIVLFDISALQSRSSSCGHDRHERPSHNGGETKETRSAVARRNANKGARDSFVPKVGGGRTNSFLRRQTASEGEQQPLPQPPV